MLSLQGARSKAHKHEATSITLHTNLLLEEVLRLEKTEEARSKVLEKLNRLAERAEKQPGVNLDMQEEASCPDLNEKLQELCHTVQLLQIRVPGLESKTGELQNKVAVTSTAMEKCDALAKSMERELESNKRTINALQDKVSLNKLSLQYTEQGCSTQTRGCLVLEEKPHYSI